MTQERPVEITEVRSLPFEERAATFERIVGLIGSELGESNQIGLRVLSNSIVALHQSDTEEDERRTECGVLWNRLAESAKNDPKLGDALTKVMRVELALF